MTEFRETRSVTTEELVVVRVLCNQCGSTIAPDAERLHAQVSAGYDAEILLDGQSYEFDLCERCLARLMDGFAEPPTVRDSWGGNPEGTTWVESLARRHKMTADSAKRARDHEEAILNGRCPHKDWWEETHGPCERAVIGKVDGEPTCALHMNAMGYHRQGVFEREGYSLTLAERQQYGIFCADRIRQRIHIGLREPLLRAIAIESGLLLLSSAADAASHVLRALVGEPPPCRPTWAYPAIAVRFPPNQSDEARLVNDWLHWAREHGFRQAAAAAAMGDSAEDYWYYYTGKPTEAASESPKESGT